ncbi:MAG: pentapeptide repeat-containing protein [bacterium]|nr:pentapeptide repeat-containing protein [bacterium]
MESIPSFVWPLVLGPLLAFLISPWIAQRTDRSALHRKPTPPPPPDSELAIAFKEWELAKLELAKMTGAARWAKERELEYLERRHRRIKNRSEREHQEYYQASEQLVMAWEDYFDQFEDLGYFSRAFGGGAKDLDLFRLRYKDALRRFLYEQNRLMGRERVWLKEGDHARKQSDPLLEENRQESWGTESPETASQPPPDLDPDASPEAQDGEPEEAETWEQESPEANPPDATEIPIESAEPRPDQMGQQEVFAWAPALSGITYVDPSFSMVQAGWKRLEGAKLQDSLWTGVVFEGVQEFIRCDFSHADLTQVQFKRAQKPHRLIACSFAGAKLNGANFAYTAFYNCDFSGATFKQVHLEAVKFVGCNFEAVEFTGLDLSKTVMSWDLLESLDFSGALAAPKNLGGLEGQREPKPEAEANPATATSPEAPQDSPPSQPQSAPESEL